MVKMFGHLLEGDTCPLCSSKYAGEGHSLHHPMRRSRDHILPRIRGGVFRMYGDTRNLRQMCQRCNERLAKSGFCIGAYACIDSVAKDISKAYGYVHKLWHMGKYLPQEMSTVEARTVRKTVNPGAKEWEAYFESD